MGFVLLRTMSGVWLGPLLRLETWVSNARRGGIG